MVIKIIETISPNTLYSWLFNILFILTAPNVPYHPPGRRHEGVAVKMRVATLGSGRRPVASAPAPGAVGAWARFFEHGPPEMFIFTMFYKGFSSARGHCENPYKTLWK